MIQLHSGKKHNVRAEILYDFQVPVGKIRDATVVVLSDATNLKSTASPPASADTGSSNATDAAQSQVNMQQHTQAKCTLLIMASNGHIYMQSLGESNTFALGGTFFATDTFELKHPEIKVPFQFVLFFFCIVFLYHCLWRLNITYRKCA